MRFLSTLAFCASLLPLPLAAATATLRTEAMLEGAQVRLSDIFDNAGPQNGSVLGPAPAPGSRFAVETAQLAAIARQFGVDWQPVSNNERIWVEREGRLLPRDLVVSALQRVAHDSGVPVEVEMEMVNFTPPLVPTTGQPSVTAEQFDYDANAGRFTASIAVFAAGMETQRFRVGGTADAMTTLVVPVRRLSPGALIRPGDLRPARWRTARIHEAVARQQDDLINHVLRRSSSAGQPVALSDVAQPTDIARGKRVAMDLAAPGLSISAVGIALEDGALGDTIHVMNPESHAILEVQIIGPDSVRVDPNSRPGVRGAWAAGNARLANANARLRENAARMTAQLAAGQADFP